MLKRISIPIVICLFLFHICGSVFAQNDWHVGRMPNGIGLHICQTDSDYVSVAFRYKVGAVNDPAGKEGLAHLFEHIAFHGSKRVSRREVDDTVALHAGRCDASVGWFETVYIWELPVSHWTFALDFELDRISSLSITNEQLELEKRIIARELDESGSHGSASSLSFIIAECLQSEHLRPIGGSKATISSITIEDLTAFHAQYYRPNNLEIFICGNIVPKTANLDVTNRFADVLPLIAESNPPKPIISPFKPLLAVSPDGNGAFLFCESNSNEYTASVTASALFNLTGSMIIRESLVSQGFVTSLSLKTVRLPELTVFAVLFTPKSGVSAHEAWENILRIGRVFAESRSFKAALDAAKNRSIAAYYRSLLASYSTVKDILNRHSLDNHLSAAYSIQRASIGDATKFAKKLFEGYTQIAISSYSRDIDSQTETLNRGKKDPKVSSEANDGAKHFFKTTSGAVIRLREVGDTDIAYFCVFFPQAATLNYETSILASLVSFHSLRGPVPITYKLEQLGWYWDIGRENWAFWGLQRNLPHALDAVLQILDDFQFYDEEVSLQTRFSASSSVSIEAAKTHLLSQCIYTQADGLSKDMKRAASKVYGSRDFCVSADVKSVNSGLKMLFSRRFGALSEATQKMAAFVGNKNGTRPGIVALTENLANDLSFVGIAWNGCAVESPDYPAFLAYASIFGANSGLSGLIVERLRHETGISYNVQVSIEHIGNAAVLVIYVVCAKEDRERAYSELKGCIERVSQGNIDDVLLNRSVASATSRLKRTEFSKWLLVTPNLVSRMEIEQLCLKRLNEVSTSDLRDASLRIIP